MSIMELGDHLCDVCINIMIEMSKISGISYGTINILLFVILGPLSTIMFMLCSIIRFLPMKNVKLQNTLSIISFVVGILCVLLVIIPVLYVILFCDY